jgi:hypothetical protein
MTPAILKGARLCLIAAVLTLSPVSVLAARRGHIKLNEDAVAFATQLIKEGRSARDGKGAWSEHKPSAQEENEFIRLHGFGEYAKWHLGIDDSFAGNTKRRYKFPFGDFKNLHRCGLLAVKSRARQYGYTAIENAAAQLERAIGTQSKR